jgi:hypothetical protein
VRAARFSCELLRLFVYFINSSDWFSQIFFVTENVFLVKPVVVVDSLTVSFQYYGLRHPR